MREPLLRAVDLGRQDPGPPRRWLYRDLSLELDPGEIVSLEGPTGSGKTLLLRGLAALDPTHSGELELLGRPFGGWPAPSWRSNAAYLHQAPPLPPGTVGAALAEPFEYGVYAGRSFDGARAMHLLARLGRGGGFADQEVEDLSGGERQVTALVRTLLTDPRVLLLDEPTAAMDPDTTTRAEELIGKWLAPAPDDGDLRAGDGASPVSRSDAESISREGPRAVLWVTHDSRQARRVARRRLRLEDGRLELLSSDGDAARSGRGEGEAS